MFGLGKLGKMGRVGGVRATIASILSKYSGSHHWDFGVSADKVAAGASMTPAQFLAAYPNHNLYQDAQGTTPAYLPTHPVGLCLDQGTGRVVLGAESVTNGELSSATGWIVDTGWAISSGAAVATAAPNGTSIYQAVAIEYNKTYRFTFTVSNYVSGSCFATIFNSADGPNISANGTYTVHLSKASGVLYVGVASRTTFTGTIDNISVKEVIGSHASQSSTTKRPVLSGRYNMLLATATLSTQSVTTLAASYKLTFTGSGTVTLSGTYVGSLVGGGSLTFTATAGTLTLTVTGSVTVADLRPANSPTNIPAYQRVTTSTDYDTAGFPLRAVWDGVDDCLVVPTLDLSITDKVTIVAGVTALSTSIGMLYEFSANYANNIGTFGAYYGGTESPVVIRRGAGSLGYTTAAPKPAPLPQVFSVQHNLAGATHLTETPVFITNGSIPSVTFGGSDDTGGANFRSDALYIGQRGGSIFPFSGSVQSITLIPALITASETAVIEASVNNSMGRVY